MSGIYIHIPFCKQACNYCNFHFSTKLEHIDTLVDAVCKEIIVRNNFINTYNIETIYFGGGTPSLLSITQIDRILTALSKFYHWDPSIEITLESNPDDLNVNYLKGLKSIGINRLSIGIQSFFEADLKWMKRAHNSHQAHSAIIYSQNIGFENLSIDLIYGSPTSSQSSWLKNLELTTHYNIPHISCYCLTVEEKTELHYKVSKGLINPIDSSKSNKQFSRLIDVLEKKGYHHYEISNFALPNYYAKHNTNYWKQIPYLGLGPSAHSYDGISRVWNISNNYKYIEGINKLLPYIESERLTEQDKYNEYIMTSLRTMWGISKQMIAQFAHGFQEHFNKEISFQIQSGMVVENKESYALTMQGKYFADKISSELFAVH